MRDLGCSIEQLRKYLAARFQPGMTWNNYGKWHIDHIVPLSSVDLRDREQLLKACHYSNLQPLWAGDNSRKGAKAVEPPLPVDLPPELVTVKRETPKPIERLVPHNVLEITYHYSNGKDKVMRVGLN